METLLANISGTLRRETLNGREYLVAPLSLIVPGVLNGSQGALYYPDEECGRDPGAWNGIPLVVYHPTRDGKPVSARSPDVLEKSGIGYAFNATYSGKLASEGWFDEARTRAIEPRVYRALLAGSRIELSTGLFTDNDAAPPDASHNGKPYQFVARNYRPDHVAILPDQRGACSLDDGCGVNNAEPADEAPTNADDYLLTNAELGEDSRFTHDDLRRDAFAAMLLHNEFASDEQKNAFWGHFKDAAGAPAKGDGPKADDAAKARADAKGEADKASAHAVARSGIAKKVNKDRQAAEHDKAASAHHEASAHHLGLGDHAKAQAHADAAREHSGKADQLRRAGAAPPEEHLNAVARAYHDLGGDLHPSRVGATDLMGAASAVHGAVQGRPLTSVEFHRAASHLREREGLKIPSYDASPGQGQSKGSTTSPKSVSEHVEGLRHFARAAAHPDVTPQHVRDVVKGLGEKLTPAQTHQLVKEFGSARKFPNKEAALKSLRQTLEVRQGMLARAELGMGGKDLASRTRKTAEANPEIMASLPHAKRFIAEHTHNQARTTVEGEPMIDRKATIAWLTTNCACWGDPGDATLLEKLSDAKLEKLHNNAMPAALAKAKKKVSKADDEEEDAADGGADEAMETNSTRRPVANSARPATEAEYLAAAPPSVREFYHHGREAVAREKQSLVGRLTANVAEAKKATVFNRLKAKSLDELREMAELLSTVTPTDNQGGLETMTWEQFRDAQNAPRYDGAGGGVPSFNHSAADEDDVLLIPTINWAEEAKAG